MEARQSVVSEALEVPVTSLTILALVAVWFRVWSNRIPASSYAYNHRDFKAGEHWRVLTATVAHESPLHLFFNVSTLWSVRHVERELGSFFVLNYSLVLMIFAKLLMHWIYGFVIARTGQQRCVACIGRGSFGGNDARRMIDRCVRVCGCLRMLAASRMCRRSATQACCLAGWRSQHLGTQWYACGCESFCLPPTSLA